MTQSVMLWSQGKATRQKGVILRVSEVMFSGTILGTRQTQ